jgi:hypothetical protein
MLQSSVFCRAVLCPLRVLAVLCLSAVLSVSCGSRPSKADLLRQQKAAKDSADWVHARRTLEVSDSLLQVLLPQADSLLRDFRYEKEDGYEDHGQYVHHLLRTDRNTARNYLQAVVRDDRVTVVRSFCYGSAPVRQQRVRISAGDLYAEAEGSNHLFEAEGYHEILTVQDDDAVRLLQFVASRTDERLLVTAEGTGRVQYVLQANEKKALAETCRLALVMKDIATLERAVRVAGLQIQKYEKRKENR